MNIENARKLVGQLERLPDEKFVMADYVRHNECGTVACIAGWCSILNGGPSERPDWNTTAFCSDVFHFARKFLGLDGRAAHNLFTPNGDQDSPWHWQKLIERNTTFSDITRGEAIAELNRMIVEAECSE